MVVADGGDGNCGEGGGGGGGGGGDDEVERGSRWILFASFQLFL